MTDTSSLLATHPTPQPYPVTAPSLASPLPNGSLSDTNPQEEEDYTIKCICAYADDDGNTVYCEKCDTWQHIECYYHGKKVPDVHFCADCSPRELDAKRATERQKRIREQIDGGDRKVKRPASKSHKKKTKDIFPSNESINGWHGHERNDSVLNGRDQPPPAKKPKTSHRASVSIASVNGHVQPESRKRASSNLQSYPSPSKSPQDLYHFPSVPKYTPEFLELYERDEGYANISFDTSNIYTIRASNKLSAWRADPSLLASEKRGASTESPFIESNLPLDSSIWPQVSLETLKNTELDYDGRYPSWRLLRLQTNVKEGDLVGQVRGQVGLLEDYCQQLEGSSNRWNELRHPDPFVFFHPLMNIYIDSRREGTQFRYLRRSCRPNVTLKTFISSDGEYHHCFVANQDIPVGSELTTQWYLPEFSNNDPVPWASKVLANFGDCACDRSMTCLIAQVDHRYPPKVLDVPAKPGAARRKKSKPKHAVSPLSTGQATNSRAGSETIKPNEDEDQYDRRSTSSSSQSHPQSRDQTPVGPGILDADPVLGTGLTARERRKLAALEKQFERAEHGPQAQKKKKRSSGGSTLNTPSAHVSRQLGHSSISNATTSNFMQQYYSDPKLSRPISGSPPLQPVGPNRESNGSPCGPSPGRNGHLGFAGRLSISKPSYVDAAVQTDPEEPDAVVAPPLKRRKFCTPTQRLLRRLLQERSKYEQQIQTSESPVPAALSSPINTLASGHTAKPRDGEDTEMKDADAALMSTPDQAPVETRSPDDVSGIGELKATNVFPFPSQAAHTQTSFATPTAPRLHLSTLPPVPSFPGAATTTTSASSTPAASVTTPYAPKSPFPSSAGSNSYPGLGSSTIPLPSPAKKKLSLGDYMSRKNLATTPGVERTQAQATAGVTDIGKQEQIDNLSANTAETPDQSGVMVGPAGVIKEEAIAVGGVEGSALEDTPMKDDDYSPPDASPVDAQAPALPMTAPVLPLVATWPSPPAAGTPGSTIAPEVENVLAQLRAMHHKETSQSSSSTRGDTDHVR